MRTRDDSKHESWTGKVIWYNTSGGVAGTGYYTNDYFRRRNMIMDELLPRADKRTRNCYHEKWTVWRSPMSFVEPHNGLDRHVYQGIDMAAYVQQDGGMDLFTHLEAKALFDSQCVDSGFNSRAFETMRPKLEADVSLANFLLELTDVSHLHRYAARSARSLRKWVRLNKKWRGKRKRKYNIVSDLSNRSRGVTDTHLMWNFGIKPMVRDLQEVWSSLVNYELRVNDFLARRRVPQRRYYSERSNGSDYYEDSFGVCVRHVRSSCEWQLKRTAVMTYTYDCAEIITVRDKLRALREILGLKLTQSVLWEAIPYSFVIDWVVDVGSWLRSRENNLIEPSVLITDYSISHKLLYDANSTLLIGGVDGWCPIDRHTIQLYRRRRALPDTDGSPLQFSGLTANQLALSFSLFNSGRPKGR